MWESLSVCGELRDIMSFLASSHSLPESSFTYGQPNLRDDENARTLTSNWREHVPSRNRVDSNSVNFISVNGGACKQAKVSAKMINLIAHRIKEKQGKLAKDYAPSKQDSVLEFSKKVDPSHAFGLPTRPSTPLMDLIQNKFGKEGEAESRKQYERYHSEQVSQSKTHMTVRKTKSSEGHAKKSKTSSTAEKQLFKLSRFKNVQSRLNVFTVPTPCDELTAIS